MKITKSISLSVIEEFKNLNKDDIESFNIRINGLIKNISFKVGIKKSKIDIPSETKCSTKEFEVIGAKNIVTALILEGCLKFDNKVDTMTIVERLETFKHNKFVHVPESLHYLSSEIVYENNEYQVVFIKDTQSYKAYKI